MTDSLFCMQRYWGSDDDDCSNQEKSSLNDNLSFSVNSNQFSNKKLVTNGILSENDIEVLDDSTSSFTAKSEDDLTKTNSLENKSLKKKRKSKKECQTETKNEFEEPVVSASQISNVTSQSFLHLKDKIHADIVKIKKSNKKQKLDLTLDAVENDIEVLSDSTISISSDLTETNSSKKKSLKKREKNKTKYQAQTNNNSEESNVSFLQITNDSVKKNLLKENRIHTDVNNITKSNKKQKLDSSFHTVENDIKVLNDSCDSITFITEKTSELKEKCVLEKKSSKQGRKDKKQCQIDADFKSKENSLSNLPNSKGTCEDEKDSQLKGCKLGKELSKCTVNVSSLNNSDEISNVNQKLTKNKKSHKLKDSEPTPCGESIQELSSSKPPENTIDNFCTIGQVQDRKDVKVRQSLPNWLSNPTYIGVNLEEEKTPITELNYLDSNTKKNLKDANINYLFPVQISVIPFLMQNNKHCHLIRPSDICVSAPTGSGKTLAFVLPIVESLKDRVVCAIRAIIVLPVGELAIQVYKVFETFTRGTDLKVTLLTGQKSFLAEQNALVKCVGQKVKSLVDIVVTTPSRVYDHIYRTKGFCLKRLRYLVIDEADRMMGEIQHGWLKQVEDAVFKDCSFVNCVCLNYKRISLEPSSAFNFGIINQPLQKLLYSATLTHDPEQLHRISMYKPKLFTASNTFSEEVQTGSCSIPNKLTMLQAICEENVKPMVVCHLIKTHQFKKVLCFTESVERAHRLHLVLEEMGMFPVREISSFSRPVQRKIVLEQFASGKINILVCSDLVARGIDIEDIDCVISYDVPQFVKIYIHRIGRTARAGKSGTAVTLLSEGEIPHFKSTLKLAGIGMPKRVDIVSEDLKPFINLYQSALLAADAKLKKEKSFRRENSLIPHQSQQKKKRKRDCT